LIAASDVHVSAWSTCHFEAVGLGTPTIVLRLRGPDRTSELWAFSNVFRADDASGLLEQILRIRANRGLDSTMRDAEADALFLRGALENAVALLREYDAPRRTRE
jgi:hypothetical protein